MKMKIKIKTSEVFFEFEDHVEDPREPYSRHTLPTDTNKWIKAVIEEVLTLHKEILSVQKQD